MSFDSEQRNTPSVSTRARGHSRLPRPISPTSLLGAQLVAVAAAIVVAIGGSTAAAGGRGASDVAPVDPEPTRKVTAVRLNPRPEWRIPAFWRRLAECETGGRWDWGRHAHSPTRRHLEGTRFEGGLGFAATTWQVWAKAVRVLDEYPHAWMAPPRIQVRVGAYGLRRGGYWGCLPYAYG